MSTTTNLKTLKAGLKLGESPRWHEGRLWHVDFGAYEVRALSLSGEEELIAHLSSMPMGIDFLPDGRLLIVASSDAKLLHREADGSLATYADLSDLSRHPWGDIVVDGRGNAYVGCIGFDFPGGQFAPGLVALVTPDGLIREVADGLAFPNGLAVTPDNRTLIAAESYGEHLTAFDIATDGSLSNRRVWAALPGEHPDGICLDGEGAVWLADVGRKHCLRVREGGQVLRTIDVDRGCFACMLGGSGRKTLFIMAAEFPPASWGLDMPRTGQVVVVEVDVAGAGWP